MAQLPARDVSLIAGWFGWARRPPPLVDDALWTAVRQGTPWLLALDGVRAARRAAELGADPAQMLAELQERDRRDSERVTAPLKPADDAVVLDTSYLTIAEAIARAIAQVDRARA